MPSKPAGNSNQTTTTTQNTSQEVKLPQWITDASQSILGQGQSVAAKLDPAVAKMNAGQQAGIQSLLDTIHFGEPQYATAQHGAMNAMNYDPQQVTPGMLSQTDLSAYTDPWLRSVIDPSMTLLDQSLAKQQNQTADLANKTGAFGGSRQGIVEGVNNAQTNLLKGQLSGQLLGQGFMNAQAQAQTDLARNLQGQALNQQAGLAGAGLNLQGANALTDITNNASNTNLQRIMAALGGETQYQTQNQNELSAARQNPIEQLQVLLSTIGGIPYGHTQTGTMTGSQTGMGPTSNPALQGLGGLASLASIAGSIAPLIPSDRTMKTDIQKMGDDPDTGLPMYAYRYKGDPKDYPKVVGPMAQDIQEKYPDQVVEVDGKLAVKAPFMAGLLGGSK